MENEVVQLYLDDIIPNRFQPREVFDDQALKELAVSIREHGVIQPILVRKFGEKYEIIAGERRYKASTMAGLTKIPAIVKNLDDKESSKVALIENLQRRDLTPIEEARTYQKILDLDEMTQEQLAKTMGKSQSAVSNKLRLLSLPDEIQEALLKEEISERHARSLLNVEDKNVQVELLKEIISNKMTVRELDSKIKKLNGDNGDTSTTDTEVNGGNSALFTSKEVSPVIENQVTNDSLFGNSSVTNVDTNISNNNSENLFGGTDNSINNIVNENANSSELIVANNEETKTENNLFDNNTGVDNMNNESLFGTSQPAVEDTSFFQNNMTSSNDTENSSALFNDPTTVDINKIREQSTDINFNVNNSNSTPNIDSLLGKADDTSNRFIPNFEDTTIEKTEDGNEVIGNGLLAGMPVIKPVDADNNTNIENNNIDFSGSNLTSPLINNSNDNSDSASSLFGSQNDSIQNNDLNSLFGQTLVNVPPVVEQKVEPASDLFGSGTQNATNNDSVISSNNVRVAVEDLKNVVKSYQDKGYTISLEELDLDSEIQLIIKFNKN